MRKSNLVLAGLLIAASFIGQLPGANAEAPDAAGYFLAPKAFRAAAAKVAPSLVTIETFGGLAARAGKARKGQMQGISGPGDGPTTGVIVSSDGLIVTSTFNFIKKPPIITVILRDGSQHVAELLGRDETRRICVLKLSGVKDLPVPEFVPRSQMRVGQWAVSVGVGYGDDDPAISAGIISATNRVFGKAIQTDANISPANYGGPLLDVEGRVLGICVPLSPDGQGEASGAEWYDSGIGFAIPLHDSDKLLAQLREGKTIQPGKLGIQPKPASAQGGVLIAKVMDGSPAGKAGLKEGDEVLVVGGEKVLDMTQMRALIGRYIAGDSLSMTVKRNGKEQSFDIKLQAGNDVATAAKNPLDVKPGRKEK